MVDEFFNLTIRMTGPYADIKKMLSDYEFRKEFIEKARARPLNDLEHFALNLLYLIKDEYEDNKSQTLE